MNLSRVIDALVEEGGLDRAVLVQVVCEGMLAAYQKKYPDLVFDASYNKQTDEIDIAVQKTVVSAVADDEREISARRARAIKADAKEGDVVLAPFEGAIGRIEILKAKQIIAQKIRGIEASRVYEEFKPKEGTIIHGVIHKCERAGAIVKVQDVYAFLPKSLMIPEVRCVVGYTIRALLKEVFPEPRNENQLILDQASPEFLQELFEVEIPEVFERIVEIKKIVRAPGYKSKIVVTSHDKNIDPVGTCVGVGGARIKPILRELGTEKIDIISEQSTIDNFVKEALRPAVINRVVVENGAAKVWLDEDQRSLAIGKAGKNISLASELVGVRIELVRSEEAAPGLADVFAASEQKEHDKEISGSEDSEESSGTTQEE